MQALKASTFFLECTISKKRLKLLYLYRDLENYQKFDYDLLNNLSHLHFSDNLKLIDDYLKDCN